ncbi:Pectate lyase superfamily protein [Pseudobythopirellula maris]|uniref:Pectate lyase superfamily protein n=1 Tax=Pseudobythopirellula maris TaxID=2527991 RepID=A0A5C5ZUE4_9BACT|nr:hypothetical protein [Pseudobythopirellula maris]TWT89793.1 Pectate lyase superfamily protein [Pseudobythopirellula maris]
MALSRLALGFVLMLAGALAANAQQPYLNIADYGAVRGDVDSTTRVLNTALETVAEHGLPIYIPAGDWPCGPLKFPYRVGVRLIGAGNGEAFTRQQRENFGGAMTQLIAVNPNEPLLSIPGSHARIEGLNLLGDGAGVGVLISKGDRKGIGSGKHTFERVTISGFDVGVKCGLEEGEHNNDMLTWRNCLFDDCKVAYQTNNHQSMGHSFDGLRVWDCPLVFDIRAGGELAVRSGLFFGSELLRLGNVGVNNRRFSIHGKVDALHGGNLVAVTSTRKNPAVVRLDLLVSGPHPWVLSRVHPSVTVEADKVISQVKPSVLAPE